MPSDYSPYAQLPYRPGLPAAPRFVPHYMPLPNGDGMDLFRKLWRHKSMIVAITVAGGVLAGAATLMMTPRYSAESQVLIGVDLPNVTDIPSLLRDMTANQEVVQSQGYVLMSRGLAAQVANRLALDQDPEFNPALRDPPAWREYIYEAKAWLRDLYAGITQQEESAEPEGPPLSEEERKKRLDQIVVSQLLAKLDVYPMQRSHVLSINAQSENPETAARIANTVAKAYIEQQLIRRAKVTENASTWLDQRIAELREKVETAERETEEYRRENGLFETRNDRVTAQQLAELNTQLIMAETERASAESRLAQTQAAGGRVESLPAVVNSPLIQALLQRKVETERQVAELGSTFGPQHPRIRDIKAQLSDIKGRIAHEMSKITQSLQHEVNASQARVATLRGNLQKLEGQLGQDNDKSIHLRELERRAEANRRLLVTFLDRAKEAEAQPNSEEENAVVISEAVTPFGPSYPPSTMLTMLGVVAGALVGMVIALFRENLDRTFRTARQVEEATNLPVLGVLPAENRSISGMTSSLDRPNSLFGQAMGNLLERLVFSPEAQGRKVLMLTSATPQEGKSQIAVALVHLVARRGLRVIILDCDWRRPTINRYFSRPATPGLGDLLAGTATPDDVVYRDPESGVHAIFAGDISLLSSNAERFARLKLLQTTLARHYDLVVIDTPPVLAGPDALALARSAEEVAFVARWGQVSRDVSIEAIRNLAFNGAKFSGVILAGVDPKRYRRYGMGDVVYPYPAINVPRAA
ncbi:Wzz/FepE/Etk N-terminal domain-containing protein [Thalassobaculum sp.]|uniref:GumC family protein n=1 Tax=Thalassobaculum sp. TaxID=2022740 RepID=UPI0032EF5B14